MSQTKIFFSSALIGFCSLLLTACQDSGDGSPQEKLIIAGSSTVAPVISDIAKRYEQEHPGVRIDVQTGGSSRGLADIRRGLADIGMVSRSARDDEQDVKWFPLAKDGLAIIVHRDNPLDALREEEIGKIYRGEITNWSALGGADRPITAVSKAEGRSTLEIFLKHFELESTAIQASVIIGDNQQGLKTVAGNPGAIGYVSIGAAEFEARRGTPIKLLHLGERIPSTAAVRSATYPITRTLHLVRPGGTAKNSGAKDDLADRFIDYCRSAAVHDLIEGQYFVPLNSTGSES